MLLPLNYEGYPFETLKGPCIPQSVFGEGWGRGETKKKRTKHGAADAEERGEGSTKRTRRRR